MAPRLAREQRQMATRLRKRGMSLREISRELACSTTIVTVVLNSPDRRQGDPLGWEPRDGRLRMEEREEILIGLRAGDSMSEIARRLGRSASMVTREVGANGGPEHYGAWRAHCRAREQARRPKAAKLEHGPLAEQVTAWLEQLWSPKEISGRLTREHPNDPTMHMSHETISQSLFVQGRRELRRELARCLRSGRTQRKHQGHVETRGRTKDMVMISERPAVVEDRVVLSHWEGDLVIGTGGRSAVGTLDSLPAPAAPSERQGDLERLQRSLNGRPRETLQFMTPSKKLAELVALIGSIGLYAGKPNWSLLETIRPR